jgi:hypothetical protein
MAVALVELVVLLAVLGLLGYGAWLVWTSVRTPRLGTSGAGRLAPRDRAWLAQAIARAGWAPAHDEVDGATRVLVRRAYTGLDGRPQVLEERAVATFPADDPAWEARFTEAMAQARFRCRYLNTEEQQG